MRAAIAVIASMVVAGCASTPPTNVTKVYDHKYNTYSYISNPQSEFVGTSAKPTKKAQPGWYVFGHP